MTIKSKSKTDKTATAPRYVLVATASRPWTVAAGWLESEADGWVVLRDARMIAYYTTESRTLFGIAAHGMHGRGRVTSAVAVARLRNVECVLDVTEAARQSIEAEPWT